jgi:hypothetical protein
MHKYLKLILVFSFLGCSHSKQTGDGGTQTIIQKYRNSVIKNKPKIAYNLLDKETQNRMPYSLFLLKWKKNRKELLSQVKELKNKKPEIEATITIDKKVKINMVSEKGKWKVKNAPGLTPAPESPKQLLNLMIKSIENYNFLTYLNLLSPAYKKAIIKELQLKIKQIENAISSLPKDGVKGDSITLPLDKNGYLQVELKKENNVWKIVKWKNKYFRKKSRYKRYR